MASYHCSSCDSLAHFTPIFLAQGMSDIAMCRNVGCERCGQRFVTKDAARVRKLIDADRSSHIKTWPQAYERSIALASAIYGLATHDIEIDYDLIEATIASKYPNAITASVNPGVVSANRQFQRPARDGMQIRKVLTDARQGVLVIPMTVGAYNHVYVVFRGSRGDKGSVNPMNAGFAVEAGPGSQTNVDWQANMFTRQIEVPWGSKTSGAKVHSGFAGLYGSVKDVIKQAVSDQLAGNTVVIVTGHSLGAALTVLCAHHLATELNPNLFCFPFNTPRVGNAAFVQEFHTQIAQHTAPLPPEGGAYHRCINTIRDNDPVSKGMKLGFVHQMKKVERKVLSAAHRAPGANTGAILIKGLLAGEKDTDSLSRFYHTPNVWLRHGKNFAAAHNYTKMQKSVIGTTLFKK